MGSLQKAIVAGGCFWCVENSFRKIKGVIATRVGYMGGQKENPTYEEVCSGKTGHAEAVEITFCPQLISYRKIIAHFWTVHDPTTLNRQGPDTGEQYRSAIFCLNPEQMQEAQESLQKVQEEKSFKDPIVTTLHLAKPFPFYEAEEYHQQYFEKQALS